MTNNDYHSAVMTHYMLREFRDQCKQQEAAATAAENKAVIDYQDFSKEVLEYPIYSNHACGSQQAFELLESGSETEYCRRWRFFYEPEPDKLPMATYRQQLDKEFIRLKRRLRTLNSPRLVIFSVTFITIILLVMRGHFLLPILPILATAWYWYYSELALQQARHELIRHADKMHAFMDDVEELEDQLLSLPPASSPDQLQDNYQQAVEHLLRDTLLQSVHPHDIRDFASVLKDNHWEGFITESWAYLQTPLPAQENSTISRLLLAPENRMMMALQEDEHGRQGHPVYRVQYLHIWILTATGLLMGYAYYDRVANRFLHERHEYYPYSHFNHIHAAEQALPESAVLRESLPEKLYHDYFRQPLPVMSLTTTTGKSCEIALPPVNRRPFRQTFWLDHYGLDADMNRLHRRLHEKIYGVRP